MASMAVMRGIAQPQEMGFSKQAGRWQLRSEVIGSTLSNSQVSCTFSHFNKPLVKGFTAKCTFQDNQY